MENEVGYWRFIGGLGRVVWDWEYLVVGEMLKVIEFNGKIGVMC